MVCRCTRTPRPGRCMDSTHRFSHLTSLPSLFRSVPALSSPVMFPCRLVCPFFFYLFPPFFPPLFRCPVPAPPRRVVLYRPSSLRARSQGHGSDSEEAGHVSQAELGTFKQYMANEVAQLQAALQRTVDDIVDTTRSSASRGVGGATVGPDCS